MLFSSIAFIFLFLPVFLGVSLLSGMRTAALLTGSVAFYTWGEGQYVLLLGALIALNYAVACWLDRREGRVRVLALVAALAIDLGVLLLFKYADFVVTNLQLLVPALELKPLGLKLPLGISFFTFQLLSYLVDVYRREVKPESSVMRFATYILMFPHLIAGPIVRMRRDSRRAGSPSSVPRSLRPRRSIFHRRSLPESARCKHTWTGG
ncbi:hypothetical protein LP415_23780 [Polaromonas sp. P1(28)-8]|nr:hypothetical protein LP415_23780 [Polaromonas sp. P1(28)-8]